MISLFNDRSPITSRWLVSSIALHPAVFAILVRSGDFLARREQQANEEATVGIVTDTERKKDHSPDFGQEEVFTTVARQGAALAIDASGNNAENAIEGATLVGDVLEQAARPSFFELAGEIVQPPGTFDPSPTVETEGEGADPLGGPPGLALEVNSEGDAGSFLELDLDKRKIDARPEQKRTTLQVEMEKKLTVLEKEGVFKHWVSPFGKDEKSLKEHVDLLRDGVLINSIQTEELKCPQGQHTADETISGTTGEVTFCKTTAIKKILLPEDAAPAVEGVLPPIGDDKNGVSHYNAQLGQIATELTLQRALQSYESYLRSSEADKPKLTAEMVKSTEHRCFVPITRIAATPNAVYFEMPRGVDLYDVQALAADDPAVETALHKHAFSAVDSFLSCTNLLGTTLRVLHNDIKMENVMLERNFPQNLAATSSTGLAAPETTPPLTPKDIRFSRIKLFDFDGAAVLKQDETHTLRPIAALGKNKGWGMIGTPGSAHPLRWAMQYGSHRHRPGAGVEARPQDGTGQSLFPPFSEDLLILSNREDVLLDPGTDLFAVSMTVFMGYGGPCFGAEQSSCASEYPLWFSKVDIWTCLRHFFGDPVERLGELADGVAALCGSFLSLLRKDFGSTQKYHIPTRTTVDYSSEGDAQSGHLVPDPGRDVPCIFKQRLHDLQPSSSSSGSTIPCGSFPGFAPKTIMRTPGWDSNQEREEEGGDKERAAIVQEGGDKERLGLGGKNLIELLLCSRVLQVPRGAGVGEGEKKSTSYAGDVAKLAYRLLAPLLLPTPRFEVEILEGADLTSASQNAGEGIEGRLENLKVRLDELKNSPVEKPNTNEKIATVEKIREYVEGDQKRQKELRQLVQKHAFAFERESVAETLASCKTLYFPDLELDSGAAEEMKKTSSGDANGGAPATRSSGSRTPELRRKASSALGRVTSRPRGRGTRSTSLARRHGSLKRRRSSWSPDTQYSRTRRSRSPQAAATTANDPLPKRRRLPTSSGSSSKGSGSQTRTAVAGGKGPGPSGKGPGGKGLDGKGEDAAGKEAGSKAGADGKGRGMSQANRDSPLTPRTRSRTPSPRTRASSSRAPPSGSSFIYEEVAREVP
ncbi:unnamed protein product [Amoebophrya sp. A120]|nr:unnamed protein product [Amoebophrya sp. A120]|eukprot:GSA120T00010611001.1